MNHGIRGRKFGRYSSHRKALIMNLAKELIEHEQITTTLPKAKDLRPVVERIITLGRSDSLSARRRALSFFYNDEAIVKKLFSVIGPRYIGRDGGYTRILKAGYRKGDCAPIAVIELINRDIAAKKSWLVKNIKSSS